VVPPIQQALEWMWRKIPVRTVGVQGDFRTYAQVIALRAVMSHTSHHRSRLTNIGSPTGCSIQT
jgi:GMP synthase PP-ATPase subunit